MRFPWPFLRAEVKQHMADIATKKADLELKLASLERVASQALRDLWRTLDPEERAARLKRLQDALAEAEAVRAELQALAAAAQPPKRGRRTGGRRAKANPPA